MPVPESLSRALSAAYAEALRVGDSPLRADRLADKLVKLRAELLESEGAEDVRARIHALLSRAEQTLRRDDDGAQAARHLKEATRLGESGPAAERKAPWE